MSDRDISILIVDDAKFSSAVVSRTLTTSGYTDVRHAQSAAEALAKLEERPASLVVADWLMPEMDGLELTRRIRQLDEQVNRYTYIMLLTAKEGVGALQKAFDEGVDDFVNKSAMNDQLLPRAMAAERLLRIHNRALIENQRLLELTGKLRKHTTVDALTGLGNRQYAIKRLDDALKQARMRGGAACLLIIQIDDFAALEQRHGKKLAQQLILTMGRRLRQLVRPMDVLARITTDTFCLITYQTDVAICTPGSFKRLYEGLNHRAYKTAGGFLQVGVSITVSHAGEHDQLDPELMLHRASRGLESSRQNKRIIDQPILT
jgi:diguanylate cyclase (GGDEF)-like protein